MINPWLDEVMIVRKHPRGSMFHKVTVLETFSLNLEYGGNEVIRISGSSMAFPSNKGLNW